MPFVLTIAEGKGRGQRFQFDAPNVTIGRGAENDVVLNDAGVSRTHARIERQPGGWLLCDNGSANGTDLNGATLEKPSPLRAGDRIGVGPVTFEFAAQGDPAETRITAAPKRDLETRISAVPAAEARSVAPRAGAGAAQGGGLAALWGGLPLPLRIGAAAAGALIVLGAARLAVQSKEQRGLVCPETVAVDDDLAGFSFGHGEVDVDCGGKVVFGFNVPPQTRVLFHYQATHIGTPSELELRLNGKHVAWAPVAGARGETQAVPLPAEALSPDGRNFVSLSQSQKGKEWAVGKVRVEMLAITQGDLRAARAAYDRGRRKLEERRIAPRNLYDAWKAFAEARRQMEGLSPRPPLYDEVAQLIKDCERDLEKECGKLIFAAGRFERYGQDERAQQTWREVLLHFPGEDPTGCRKKAQQNIVSAQTAEASE
jgi:nucleoid-associated protein YgaU